MALELKWCPGYNLKVYMISPFRQSASSFQESERLWRLEMDLIVALMIVFYRILFGFGRSRNYGIPNSNEISVTESIEKIPEEEAICRFCNDAFKGENAASFTKLSDQTKLNPGIQGRCRASTSSIPIVTKALNLMCPYKHGKTRLACVNFVPVEERHELKSPMETRMTDTSNEVRSSIRAE
ncbi:hypothetical protein LguiA_029888 [Lonicera macranthoides]